MEGYNEGTLGYELNFVGFVDSPIPKMPFLDEGVACYSTGSIIKGNIVNGRIIERVNSGDRRCYDISDSQYHGFGSDDI